MKKIAPFIIAMCCFSIGWSQKSADSEQLAVVNTEQSTIQWLDFETAQEMNKKEPRKFIVDVYTSWCGWCKRMDASTFHHPVIVDYINENYYAVKFNAESKKDIAFKGTTYVNPNPDQRRATHQLAGIAAVNGRLSYPTIVYLDEELNLLSQVQGYKDAAGIEPIIHFFAEEVYKENQNFQEYLKTFKSSVKQAN